MAAPKDITSSKLFEQLDLLVGVDGIDKDEVTHLRSALLKIAERAGIEWGTIRTAFPQYTDHSVQHMVNILDLIYDFLPKKKAGKKEKIQINALELTLLIAAVLLHDVGMAVTPAEKEAAKNDPQYRQLRSKMNDRVEAAEKARKAGDKVTADAIDDAIMVEFFRKEHAALSAAYIRKLEAPARLMFAEVDLHETLAQIAESHAWSVEHGRGDKAVLKLSEDERFGKTRVNVQFLAFCLRLADILDFDRSRTPQYLFKQINFTEEISIQEWKKHLSVTGWQIQKDKVSYRVACDSPETYVAVQEFLHWVDKELDAFHRAHRDWKGDDQDRYALNLAVKVDRDKVSMANKNHMAGDFRFTLDYEKIMNLLMDRSLYPDPAMFLRELLQNSLDACRLQKARAIDAKMGGNYRPVIQVYDHTDDPKEPRIIFQDNGVGMSLDKVKNYFLQVGKSFYQSWEFRHEKELLEEKGIYLDSCSRFGIGFLSCFLGGDKIEVQTYEYGSEPLKITIYGPDKYFLIEKLGKQDVSDRFNTPIAVDPNEPLMYAGTKISVYLRSGWRDEINPISNSDKDFLGDVVQIPTVFEILRYYAVNQEFCIKVTSNGKSNEISRSRWDLEESEVVFPDFSGVDENEIIDLLFRHEVKFEDYQSHFPGIRGRSWMWLLNNRGVGVPELGNMGLYSSYGGSGSLFEKSPIIPRNMISYDPHDDLVLPTEQDWNLLLEIAWEESEEIVRESVCRIHENVFRHKSEFISNLIKIENSQRRDLIEALRDNFDRIFAVLSEYGETWAMDGEIVKLLQDKDDLGLVKYLGSQPKKRSISWVSLDISPKNMLSIHGILLPSGIIDWNPLTPTRVKSTRFLPPFTTAKIDLRGDLAPIPAPHRLSCTATSAENMIESVHRILIREIHKLYLPNQLVEPWREWFYNYINFFRYNALAALWKELDLLKKHLRFRYRDADGIIETHTWIQLLNFESEFYPVANHSDFVWSVPEKEGYLMEDLLIPRSEVTQKDGIDGVFFKAWMEKKGYKA